MFDVEDENWVPEDLPAAAAPKRPPLLKANVQAAKARLLRAEWLLMVRDGLMTPADLIWEAATAEGRPLRKLRLTQVLAAQPSYSRDRAKRTVARLHDVLELSTEKSAKVTVGWLIDHRAGGRRVLAWLDQTTPRRAPWPGFPFTPYPSATTEVSS